MGAGAVAETAGRLAKPQLKGLHNAAIKKNLIVAGVLVTAVAIGVKFFRNEPRKRDYAEFYKTYDANKSFERMLNADLLQCTKTN